MSHFSVYVFTTEKGKDVEELLAPYDEDIDVAPYVAFTREEAIADERKSLENYKNSWFYQEYLKDPKAYEEKHKDNPEHLEYLRNFQNMFDTITDEELYQKKKDYYEDDMVTPKGDLLSTYNPNSKWDWYSIGGRWSGTLVNKEGDTVSEANVSDIDWNNTQIPFAYVEPNGVWKERGEMGWFACVSNEKDENVWNEEFNNFLKSLPDDAYVTVVDCHI